MTDLETPPTLLDATGGMAALHLRMGSVQLARAELESLAARGVISGPAFADLAEARWRLGDLDRAAEAAAAYRAADGDRPIARLILAEAAAAAGRMEDAAEHVTALADMAAPDLAALFAGMPHRASWPVLDGIRLAPNSGVAQVSGQGSEDAPLNASLLEASPEGSIEVPRTRRRVTRRPPAEAFPEPPDLLAQAKEDMRSGDPERMASAFDRLALTLRLDPSRASAVTELISRRTEAAALLVRGDAMRILGRALESEAAYAGAAKALAKEARRGS